MINNKTPRVLAVTGGKGGVGKTSISINLSIALSRTGSKVCLFDGDTGLANTNIMLGLYPAYTLEHLFTGEKSIQDIVLDGPEGIQIVPGASGVAQCVDLDFGQQQRLVTSLRSIEPHYDYMIVDTAAGISPTVLHFIAASQVAVIVITPEPTSLTDAFSLLKVLSRRGYKRKVQIIINMVSSASQAKRVFQRFSQALEKYLKLDAEYLGSVWMDESMRTAVSLQRPVALYPKNDPSARSFYRLAERIDDVFSQKGVPKLAFSAYWQKVVERDSFSRAKVVDRKPVITQAQKQLEDKIQRSIEQKKRHTHSTAVKDDEYIRVEESSQSNEPLATESDDAWLDLRLRMNQFFNDDNTTPEQVITLLSSCIYSYGERLGTASVDLLHGLLHALDPDKLSLEQKLLLASDYEHLGIDKIKQTQQNKVFQPLVRTQEGSRAKDELKKKISYDARGFGNQHELVNTIRSSSQDLPLESLLESIKYASLVDSSDDG